MRWFKHMTDGHADRDINDAIREYGINAYAFYYILSELYGLYYNDLDDEGFLSISIKEVQKNTHIRRSKVILLLEYFSHKQKLQYKQKGKYIMVKIPEFIKLAGSWRIRAISENVTPNRNGISPLKEERVNEEIGNEKNNEYEVCIIEGYEILTVMNKTFTKYFKNANFIINLLRQGRKKEDFLKIIEIKKNDPFFITNPRLYNPQTLFKDEHFEKYLEEDFVKKEEKIVEEKLIDEKDTYELSQKYYDFLVEEMPSLQAEFFHIIYDNGIDQIFGESGMDLFEDVACYKLEKNKIYLYPKMNLNKNYLKIFIEIRRRTEMEFEILYKVPDDFKNYLKRSDPCLEY